MVLEWMILGLQLATLGGAYGVYRLGRWQLGHRIAQEKAAFLTFYNQEKKDFAENLPKLVIQHFKEYIKGYTGKATQEMGDVALGETLGPLSLIMPFVPSKYQKAILGNPAAIRALQGLLQAKGGDGQALNKEKAIKLGL